MDKKENNSSNPQGICEKFFNAISVTPTFQTIRRISHHPKASVAPPVPASQPASAPALTINLVNGGNKPNTGLEQTHKDTKKVSQVVHTKTDSPLPVPPKPTKEKEQLPLSSPPVQPIQERTQVPKVNTKPAAIQPTIPVLQQKGKSNGEVKSASPAKKIEEGKSKATKKAEQPQPRPETVTGKKEEGKKFGALTGINDKAADYINRAKNKIRTTSK